MLKLAGGYSVGGYSMGGYIGKPLIWEIGTKCDRDATMWEAAAREATLTNNRFGSLECRCSRAATACEAAACEAAAWYATMACR